jgi:tripartite-type tricarboxylate transporter receptor subunit TctC
MSRRNFTRAAIAAALFPLLVPAAAAQSNGRSPAPWPTRPLRILVGFPPGSTPDMAARTFADALAKALGQPVIVENKAGASGNIAADQVAKASDDHTLGVLINGNLTTAKMLYAKLPYDPQKDFTPLSLLATAPLVLVAAGHLPEGAAFFTAASQKGSQWFYGSVGNGSVGHLGMEVLKSRIKGLAPTHVPFKGNPEVITALIAGEIQMALVPPGLALPHVRSGKLKAIGVTSGRSPLVPEVAPLADAGVRDFNLEVWTALVGPAKLSPAARDRLNAEVAKIMRDPDTRQKLFNQGWQAVGTTPEGLQRRVREEAAMMGSIITSRGIRID